MSAEREVLNAAAAALRNAGYATTADELIVVVAAMQQRAEAAEKDARRLDLLQRESWDLRCFDFCQGEDVGWRVISHHMAEPCERVVAEVFADDPRAAIDAASTPPQAEGEGK